MSFREGDDGSGKGDESRPTSRRYAYECGGRNELKPEEAQEYGSNKMLDRRLRCPLLEDRLFLRVEELDRLLKRDDDR